MTPQEAQAMLESLAEAYGSPAPRLEVTEHVPPGLLAAFLEHDWSVQVRPEALTPQVLAHEFGHSLHHWLHPGVCEGMGSPGYGQCESFARRFERAVNGSPSLESFAFILAPMALGLALLR